MKYGHVRFTIVAVSMFAAGLFLQRRSAIQDIPNSRPLAEIPKVLDGWTSEDQPVDSDTRRLLGPGDFLARSYRRNRDGALVDLYVAYFPSQTTGDTIHTPRNCLPGVGWEFESTKNVSLSLPGMNPVDAHEGVVTKGTERLFVLYWYQAHGRGTGSEYWAKFYLAMDAVRMGRTDGGLVRFLAPLTPGESEAGVRERTVKLASQLSVSLRDYIPD